MSNEENLPKVQITYSIDDNLETTIDIVLEDYSDETLLHLFALLDVLSLEGTYLQTVQVMGENFKAQGKEKELYELISHVTAQQTKKSLSSTSDEVVDSIKEKPCIKPSDML
jgi:hypothetical protein